MSREISRHNSSRHSHDAQLPVEMAQPAPVRFIDPLYIIPGLVADALEKKNPVLELLTLQQKRWFDYPKAQQCLIDYLWRVERDEFDCLIVNGVFTDRLRGCISHSGELFERFGRPTPASGLSQGAVSGERAWKHGDVIQHQRIAWAGLLTEELQYLARKKAWCDDERAMAYHACVGLNLLAGSQSSLDSGTVPAHLLGPLVHALSGILGGAPLQRLISRECSGEDALVLHEIISLAISFDDVVISEEVVGLLPALFVICQARFPVEFSKEDRDDADQHEYGEDELIDDATLEDDPLEDDIDDRSDNIAAGIQDPHGYEVIGEEELADDPSWRFSELSSAEDEFMANSLVSSLGLCLRELRRLPASKNHVECIKYILGSAPIGMVLWQEFVDTLISVSPSAFEEFLPTLLHMCLEDESGGLCILGIADYAFRKGIDPKEGPLLALVHALRVLTPNNRQSLLTSAAEFLECAPELFLDPEATRQGFKVLSDHL